jgi:ligand-binding sensor domain-containing protein/signal transduction histidine kinase
VKTLLSFWTFLLLLCQHGQGQSIKFDHFTLKDGLSQSQAFSIFQDSYGYIWLGTQDGLNRFDGNHFKVFKNDPFDSTTLTHNWVWSVQEDSQGDLWIGTYKGLCKYVRGEDKFIQYYHSSEDSTSISGNRPNCILKDNKGRLWISSWNSGLNLYNEEANTFTRFKNDPNDAQSISHNYVRTMYCDSQGNIWIGTWNGGLNRVIEDDSGIHFQRYSEGERDYKVGTKISSIAEDTQGNLWICTHDAGLMILDRSVNRFMRVPNFSQNRVNKVIRDKHGNMWIGTDSGLSIYNDKSKEFHSYHHDPSNPSGISSNPIFTIFEDRAGMVWVSGNGLDLYNPRKISFETFQNKQGDPNSLSENLIRSFCEDDEKKIWIGSESNHIDVFNPQLKSFKQIFIGDNKGNIADNIYKMAYKNGVFWIVSHGDGLIRYEKYTGRTTFYFGTHASPLGKISLVNELMMDDDNTLWIGSDEDGLLHYNPLTEEVVQYKVNVNDPNGIPSNLIKSIHKDKKGNIWISFSGAGVGMLDKDTKKFTNYRYDRKNAYGLSDQIVNSITQQNDSIFWLCSFGGLNKLNVNTGKFTHFFEKDGLANNVIYEMLEDENGNYWISSNGGLSKFNPRTYSFKNYTEEDGLQSNEFNSDAVLKSSSGEFYFGGINGFNVFKPENIKENTEPLPLLIQGYTIFDKSYLPEERAILKYFQNYITFSFAALEFSTPNKVKYAYKLEGFDKDWVHVGNQREAHYTNLDAGHYTFQVKASNPDGYWTEPGTSMIIIIRPPFWRTWWFTSLAILMSAALMYAVHRYRLEQTLKVERLRNKIASDLHDEVGSSLSRISIYSDLLQNGTETHERKNYLTGIGELSREVVNTMSDIVWSIDNRNDTLGSLIIRMKDFATEILQAKNIDLEFSIQGIDDNNTLDPALKQNIYLIFKESIHNIVKHAQASHVHVSLINKGGEFRMAIKDDGRGFTASGKANGNGLRNMQRRAMTVQGEFEIKNQQGTTLILTRKAL